MTIKKIKDNIYQVNNDSNIYYLKNFELIIDAGNKLYCDINKKELEEICDLSKIKIVIFTHLHHDHIGCFDLFENAKFYSTKRGIEDLNNDKKSVILNDEVAEKFNVELLDVNELSLDDLEFFETPGHSSSGLCVYDKKNKILFSGDTKFDRGYIGRYDLPTSSKEELKKSLTKIDSIDYEILCPGHNY